MHHLPEALFTRTDAVAAVICVVAALCFAVLPQFTKHWDVHWLQRLVLGIVMGVAAFLTPLMLLDTMTIVSNAFRSVLFWIMPWVCLVVYLVGTGAGYLRRAWITYTPKS